MTQGSIVHILQFCRFILFTEVDFRMQFGGNVREVD